MATLEAHADKVVRDAVDAFMEGRLVPDFVGETVFETKNSRYRLVDGVVAVGPDPSLVGAELVGWLCESGRRCLVESVWQPGSRAVLVDRKQGRNIIVTSTTHLLHLEDTSHPSQPSRAGKSAARTAGDFRSWHPPANAHGATPAVAFSPAQPLPIVAATPAPPSVAEHTRAPAHDGSAPALPQRPVVHPPPRPIAPHPPPRAIPPMSVPLAARPLPAPLPPPRREPVDGAHARPTGHDAPMRPPEPPSQDTPWEVTSSEIEIASEPAPAVGPEVRHDAMQQDEADSMGAIPIELVRPIRAASEAPAEAENLEPFPLVKPGGAGTPRE